MRLTLRPGERVPVAFVTGAAETRERALELVEKYRDVRAGERAFELAWSQAQLEPRHLRVSLEDLQRYQQLAAFMIYPKRPPARQRAGAAPEPPGAVPAVGLRHLRRPAPDAGGHRGRARP